MTDFSEASQGNFNLLSELLSEIAEDIYFFYNFVLMSDLVLRLISRHTTY